MHDVNVPQYKIHKKLGDYLHEPVVVGPEGGGGRWAARDIFTVPTAWMETFPW
jgi:hypothetical protein